MAVDDGSTLPEPHPAIVAKTIRTVETPDRPNRFRSLDGLRGVAAIMVLLFHERWWLPHGKYLIQHAYLAVDFFFMLSGFVIAHAYQTRLRADMRIAEFVRVRAIRLYPLIIAGALLGVVSIYFSNVDHVGIVTALEAFPFAAASLPMPPGIMPQPFNLNGPGWSLFFEISVNIVFAVVTKQSIGRKSLWLLIPISIAYFAVSHTYSGVLVGWTYATLLPGFVRAFYPFSLGICILVLQNSQYRMAIKMSWPIAGLLLITTFIPLRYTHGNSVYDYLVVSIVYPLILAATSNAHTEGRWARLAIYAGFLSYPLYVLQSPLIGLFPQCAALLRLPIRLFIPVATMLIILVCSIFGMADFACRRKLASLFR